MVRVPYVYGDFVLLIQAAVRVGSRQGEKKGTRRESIPTNLACRKSINIVQNSGIFGEERPVGCGCRFCALFSVLFFARYL